MEGHSEFLKFIFHEDLFVINEPSKQESKGPEYSDDLDSDIEEVPTSTVEESSQIPFFGQNEKGILILVRDDYNDLLNQSDLDFLMKIIESGLRYSKNDFALVNIAKHTVDQIFDEIPYEYLISFGIDESHFNKEINFYQIQVKDNKKELFGEALSIISNDTSKKMKLWKALKSMFNIQD